MRQYLMLAALLLLIGLLYWSAPLNRCADDACRIGVAVETGNARLCAGLEATRSWCYRDVAVAILDAEVCDAIPEMASALHCRADVAAAADDLPSCEALGGGARDSCLDAIARSRSAGSLCGGIGVAAFRDICAFDIGLAANDPDSCLAMADVNRSYRCVTFVAMGLNSSAPCARIPQPDRDWCVASVAMKTGNLTLCEDVVVTSVYSACRIETLKR